jgi:hypothetical protein
VVQGTYVLRPFEDRDHVFESRSKHVCRSVSLDGLIPPFKETYQIPKRFIVLEVNSELQQVGRPNLLKV